MGIFEQITVNIATGAISYPSPKGFELKLEQVYSSAERMLPHCQGNLELAVRHAIHQQIIAFEGAAPIRRALGGA